MPSPRRSWQPWRAGEPEDQLARPWKGSSRTSRSFAASNESGSLRLAKRRCPRSRLDPIMRSRCEMCSSALWKSRRPAKAPTRGDTKVTTRSNGKSCNRFPTCSTRTATRSAFGRTANSSARSSRCRATSKRRATSSPPRSNSSRGSTTFFAGSRSRRSPPRNLPRSRLGCAACCATKSPSNSREKSPALTALAADWRKLLFPEANDQQFADGYAQAVTFGLLMARSSNIRLADGLDQVGKQLGKTNSLIGAALRLLTDEVGNAGDPEDFAWRRWSACSTP